MTNNEGIMTNRGINIIAAAVIAVGCLLVVRPGVAETTSTCWTPTAALRWGGFMCGTKGVFAVGYTCANTFEVGDVYVICADGTVF
jgi:hypothetical protein